MTLKKIVSTTFIILLAISLSACSDNGSGGEDPGEPPSIPNLSTKVQPDISFFQNNNPKKGGEGVSTTENFYNAKSAVMSGAAFLGITQTYMGFFNPASQEEADFVNGSWVWEYSYSQGGQSLSVQTTATPQSDGFSWETIISFDDGEGGGVSDFKIMEGTTSNDGSQGDWKFYSFEDQSTSTAVMTSQWTIVSETEKTIDIRFFDQGNVSMIITYNQNGPENLMSFEYTDSAENMEIFWNTDSGVGYFMSGSETFCWDSSFQDISCSDIGF